MTSEKLIELMSRHGLSREDLASISGKSVRQVYSWTSGIFSVPRSVAIVLYAVDDGRIDPQWILSAIRREYASE